MQADPFVLARLAARAALATTAAAAATAALQAYLDTGVAELEDDLVSLKDAEVEFGISNLTARRWAKDKNLGARGRRAPVSQPVARAALQDYLISLPIILIR